MAIDVVLRLRVEGKEELAELTKQVEAAGGTIKTLEDTAKKSGDAIGDGLKNADQAANNLQGGIGGVIKQIGVMAKAAKKGGLAMRSAMIATGIGAFVVALGWVVANWELISDFVGLTNKDLERQQQILEASGDLLDQRIKTIRAERKLAGLQGKNIDDLIVKEKELLGLKLKNLQAQLLTSEAAEAELKLKSTEKSFLEKIGFSQFAGKGGKVVTVEEELGLKEAAEKSEKLRTELALLQQEIQFPKKTKSGEKEKRRDKIKGSGIGDELQAARDLEQGLLEVKREFLNKKLELVKANDAEIFKSDLDKNVALASNLAKNRQDEIDKANAVKILNEQSLLDEKILAAQKVAVTQQALGAVIDVLGKNTAAGKAASIALATINTWQGVTQVWKSESLLPEPLATISKVASTASVLASGFKAVAAIKAQKLPSFARGGGSGGGTGSAGGRQTAPSFNLVGQSPANQIAESLQRDDQPLEAYVVSTSMTSRQSLDRNIESNATLG